MRHIHAGIRACDGMGPLFHVRLRVDGKDLVRKTPLVFIGNNKYEMEGLNIGERKRLDAGEFASLSQIALAAPTSRGWPFWRFLDGCGKPEILMC